MANFGGQWVIGNKFRDHGVDYLKSPLAYWIANGKHGVVQLPDDPDMIPIDKALFSYPLRDGEIKDLFLGARSGLVKQDKQIVLS